MRPVSDFSHFPSHKTTMAARNVGIEFGKTYFHPDCYEKNKIFKKKVTYYKEPNISA